MNYLLVHCEIVPVVQQLVNQSYQMKEMVLVVKYGHNGYHPLCPCHHLCCRRHLASKDTAIQDLQTLQYLHPGHHRDTHRQTPCYNFRRLRQSSTVVVSKVQSQMNLEECKSWTCIVLLGLRARVQVKGLSIKD